MTARNKSKKRSAVVRLELPSSIRRTLGGFIVGVVLAFQVTSCAIKSQVPVSPSAAGPTAPTAQVPQQPAPALGATGFAACPQHFAGPPPKVDWPGMQRELCFDGFAVLYSGESKTPIYVAERLNAASVEAAKGLKRSDRFYPEARLPSAYRAQLADYAGSRYDRGHMAPAGDMPTPEAKAQSFSLANMVPQNPQLNQHDWSQIEQATRKYAARASGDVFTLTGPKFAERPETIGPGKVWIPSHTWKLVQAQAEARSWGYWMSNDAGPHSLKPISLADVTTKAGLPLQAGP